MTAKRGNAEIKAMGQIGNLLGKVGQHLWPTLKSAISSGVIDLQREFTTDNEIKEAIGRGFLFKKKKPILEYDIGKVSKDKLASLSLWDLKNLYPLFYQQAFGLYLDFPDELVPDGPDEFIWPICIPGIISNETVFRSGKLDIPRWRYAQNEQSLDSIMNLNHGRDAWMHSYIVLTKPNWEADDDLKNFSGSDIEVKKINVMMFRERWILGLFLTWLMGDRIDRKGRTLTGSRYLNGDVLSVHSQGTEGPVNVTFTGLHECDIFFGFRQVISI
ncbi:MAG: hypothetical protein US30_C0007G0036 [Candidatus Moranbacteria bacterium GW2011_GWF2_36_839]|nr:MAG: hypothetical protein US27_C0007G0014 [Candidatus Moranbacteria bacterium GW2011_GWF1_36_78]KKQ17090.1 MAG: hypothetical protein US30_C0007G0036 [Candidatus Moranbacteria bacterium GW2011_GWF2_36_839]HAT73694.1 hypothetical protein [Candidatus Moranbacteria bacterium]HBY11331.1 hypothetical protein [Candidatus Moranbacteria bacterium]